MNPTNQMRAERRSGNERRRVYDLDYFAKGGLERRCYGERRKIQDIGFEIDEILCMKRTQSVTGPPS